MPEQVRLRALVLSRPGALEAPGPLCARLSEITPTGAVAFESTLSPNIVWVNLNQLNLGPGSGVRAVAVEGSYSLIGNINADLAPAQPIAFLAP